MATGARIRVVLFITELALGGTPRRLQALAERLDRARFEPHVLSILPGGAVADALRSASVPVETLGVRNKLDLLAAWRLRAYLRRVRPQILHAFNFHANLLAKVVGRLFARVPVIVVSEASVESAKPGWRIALDGLTTTVASAHYANAEAVRQVLITREGTPSASVTVVSTGVDVEAFKLDPQKQWGTGIGTWAFDEDFLSSQQSSTPREPVVVCVGRLDKYKGHEFLLVACARERTRPYRLILVGDGPMRRALEAQAAALGIVDRVSFAGAQEDVRPFLARADCVALASTEEGMPGSILEAMAMARPVVATAVGGVPEAVIDGVTGYLVPSGDVGALAAAISAVLADPAKSERMGRAARERVEKEFRVELMIRKTEGMYETLVASRGGGGGGTA